MIDRDPSKSDETDDYIKQLDANVKVHIPAYGWEREKETTTLILLKTNTHTNALKHFFRAEI